MTTTCCDPKGLPSAIRGSKLELPRPNPHKLTTSWSTIEVPFYSVVKVLSDPGVDVIAVPYTQQADATSGICYTSVGGGANRVLHLHAPGTWKVRLQAGGTDVEAVVLDYFNGFGALAESMRTTVNPTTFVPTHVTPIDIDAGADEQVLAAGAYAHLYFRNVSPAAGILTITGNGVTAVNGTGWTLAADPTGGKAGEILVFNNPDRMPIGPFRAIASVDNQLLSIVTGV